MDTHELLLWEESSLTLDFGNLAKKVNSCCWHLLFVAKLPTWLDLHKYVNNFCKLWIEEEVFSSIDLKAVPAFKLVICFLAWLNYYDSKC